MPLNFGQPKRQLLLCLFWPIYCMINMRVRANPTLSALRAAAEGDMNRLRKAVSRKHPDSIRSRRQQTLLWMAANGGHIDAVKALLKAGADPTIQDEIGESSISQAALTNDVEIVKLMARERPTAFGGDEGARALWYASVRGKLEFVTALLEAGVSPNMQARDRPPALVGAVMSSCDKCVAELLNNGADPTVTDSIGRTPLHIAAQKGGVETVRLLLEKDVSAADVVDSSGIIPIRIARTKEIYELLYPITRTKVIRRRFMFA